MKKPTPEFCESALEVVRRSNRPTLIGHVALALNCSLSEAEDVLLALLDKGRIRVVTPAEMNKYDVREGFLPV